MKPVYERENLIITEFDSEDVIATSSIDDSTNPVLSKFEKENVYRSFNSFNNGPGSWF